MPAHIQSLKQSGKTLANAGRDLMEPILRHADVLLARTVAAVSLGIFGVTGLVTDSAGIIMLGLVPIFVFEYLLNR